MTCNLFTYTRLKGTSAFKQFIEDCDKSYDIIPYFKYYQNYFEGKHYILLVVALLIIPLTFFNIKMNADAFVSHAIVRIQKRFRISPLIAAFTLIPLANGAPDLIVTYIGAKSGGGSEDIAVGTLASSFVFAATVVVAAVILCSKQQIVRIPVLTIVKEIGFFFLSYGFIVALGIYGHSHRYFALISVFIFFLYIAVSIFMAMRMPEEEEKPLEESQQELSNVAYTDLPSVLRDYLFDAAAPVSSVLSLPSKCLYLVSVPNISNPFYTTHIQYVVLGVAACVFTFGMDIPVPKRYLVLVGAAVALACFGLMQIELVADNKVLIFDVLTLFVAIAWIKIFSTMLLDSIKYISFVMGVGKTFVSMIIISLGNSTPDLFSNASIAKEGGAVMALVGTLSSQFANFTLGTAIFIAFNKSGAFDLFALVNRDNSTEKRLMKIIFLFAFGSMFCVLGHATLTKGFTKSYAYIALSLYVCFLLATGVYSFS